MKVLPGRFPTFRSGGVKEEDVKTGANNGRPSYWMAVMAGATAVVWLRKTPGILPSVSL